MLTVLIFFIFSIMMFSFYLYLEENFIKFTVSWVKGIIALSLFSAGAILAQAVSNFLK